MLAWWVSVLWDRTLLAAIRESCVTRVARVASAQYSASHGRPHPADWKKAKCGVTHFPSTASFTLHILWVDAAFKHLILCNGLQVSYFSPKDLKLIKRRIHLRTGVPSKNRRHRLGQRRFVRCQSLMSYHPLFLHFLQNLPYLAGVGCTQPLSNSHGEGNSNTRLERWWRCCSKSPAIPTRSTV